MDSELSAAGTETSDVFPIAVELAIGVQIGILVKNLLLEKSGSYHLWRSMWSERFLHFGGYPQKCC